MKAKFLLSLLCAFSALAPLHAEVADVSQELREQNTPQGWTAVQLPNITINQTITLDNLSAVSDNATAINDAIATVNEAGGGKVIIPAGTWLSGPIVMKSNVVFHLSAEATLKMLPYGQVDSVGPDKSNGYFPASELKDGKYSFPVFISSASWNGSKYSTAEISNVIVEGEGETSVIDGDGAAWWAAYQNLGTRPGLIRFGKGTNFLFRNFKMQNAPGTNLTLGQSGNASNFTVHDVTIVNPSSKAEEAKADDFTNPDGSGMPSHNTDGIPVWGPYVNIYHCNISTGDDNVVFDSNSQYCHVWNCQFGRGHGASMGSYTANMHDILWEDITFNGTAAGFRMKSNSDRSGEVYNITMRNCTMSGITENPISINMWYDESIWPTDDKCVNDAVTTATMNWHDITLQNITSTGTNYTSSSQKRGFPIHVFGRKNAPIHGLVFDNVHVEAAKGMQLAYCNDIVFKNGCKIINTAQPGNVLESTSKSYDYVGSLDGSANPTYDKAPGGNLFSLAMIQTNKDPEKVPAGKDQLLNGFATIVGGSALVHNGHSSSAASMITKSDISCGNSGSSYIKITLNTPLKAEDVLTTEGTDGGYVTLSPSNTAENNIRGNSFTFTKDFNNANVIYINRGDKNNNDYAKYTSITIRRAEKLGTFMNISDWSLGNITQETTVNGLTYVPASDEKSEVDNATSVAECGGLSFKTRLKMGGSSSNTGRYLKFNVPANCYIRIYCAHASSEGDSRHLYAQFGGNYTCTKDNEHELATLEANEKKAVTYQYTGDATTAYLYSDEGLNFFGIRIFFPYCYINGQEYEMSYDNETGALSLDKDLEITDQTSFTSNVEFTARNASYEREMKNQWGTICLPFNVTYNKKTNPYDFYYIEGVNNDEISLKCYTTGSKVIPAGTPMVVRRNAAESGINIQSSNCLVAAEPGAGTSANGLSLKGTFTDMTIHNGEGYYIASNAFWPATKDVKVGAFRAYFKGEVTGAAAAGQLRISVVEDEETSIEQLNTNVSFDDAQIFNLQGTRQSDLRSGISLVRMPNGSVRKLIVK